MSAPKILHDARIGAAQSGPQGRSGPTGNTGSPSTVSWGIPHRNLSPEAPQAATRPE